MRRKTVAGIAVVALAAAVAGVWLAAGRDEEPWPPVWYVDLGTNRDEYIALRKRLRKDAVDPPDTDFPPSPAKLGLLRLTAVGACDARPKDARVYFSNNSFASEVIRGAPLLAEGASVYLLALRGKFSTAWISRPPSVKRPMPEFRPMLILLYDAATMDHRSTYLGRARDLSPLGESIELDLDAPLSRG
jgi:hypothetical protein